MPGSSTAANADAVIRSVEVIDAELIARLSDGRSISVPIAWFWRLRDATEGERLNFRLIGGGQGVRWPDIDEDISLHGMLHGLPARPASRG
jgi:hypothetical protein